ncbi:MAG: DUF4062 domain-containing protein [Nanoarchaeota archaeon]|nr:DUF4062 domain-containing protein [Nanoarchaeota archaeon]
MGESFQLIRVFLASPGGLQEERRLASEAAEEINELTAKHHKFRVELLGWEDTLSASGRPQDIINQELDKCELFIGIMWKKWGTPPSVGGKYTSGFEEEFERSSARLLRSGQPKMAMYFKEVSQEFLIDPGDDLKKVISFKEKLIAEKKILFENFKEPSDFQKCIRKKITDYLLRLSKNENEITEEKQSKPRPEHIEDAKEKKETKFEGESPFSNEGHSFLEDFLKSVKDSNANEKFSSFEVARFRLLAGVISKTDNTDSLLGAHDANIIFLKKNTNFGDKEISKLIDSGLGLFKHENAPLWHWYHLNEMKYGTESFAFRAFHSIDDVAVGVLDVMNLLSLPILDKHRELLLKYWLRSKDRSDGIKLATLRYLKNHGTDKDLHFVQEELDEADSRTSMPALETLLNIKMKYNKAEAFKTLVSNQFEHIDNELLARLLSDCQEADDEALFLGSNHSNKDVRLKCFKLLCQKNKANSELLGRYKEDPAALIRWEAVKYFLSTKQAFSDSDVRDILVKPKKNTGLGSIFSLALSSDSEGLKCYDEYLYYKYSLFSEKDLLDIVEKGSFLDSLPYFALCRFHFKNQSEELRKNVDDRFEGFFEKNIDHLKSHNASEQDIKKLRDLEGFIRRQMTREGLDILCDKGNICDLKRIRKNMRSEYTESSLNEIEYMKKCGEWEDIEHILKLKKDSSSRTSLLSFSNNSEWNQSIAKVIYSIGKNRLDELLRIKISSAILVEIIKISSSQKFSKISSDVIFSLLNHKEDFVRKETSLKVNVSFKKSEVKNFLKQYTQNDKYRYYNVIFWLDFGASMSRPVVKQAVKYVC